MFHPSLTSGRETENKFHQRPRLFQINSFSWHLLNSRIIFCSSFIQVTEGRFYIHEHTVPLRSGTWQFFQTRCQGIAASFQVCLMKIRNGKTTLGEGEQRGKLSQLCSQTQFPEISADGQNPSQNRFQPSHFSRLKMSPSQNRLFSVRIIAVCAKAARLRQRLLDS